MTFSIVIPSARAQNLIACLRALRACEPGLTAERIIVVDDGARAGAETVVGPVTWISGEKPFVFARNANLGIDACPGDVILLNDDAELVTAGGFTAWSEVMSSHLQVGICSAGIRGLVGNPRQRVAAHARLELESASLAFVCVYLPRRVLDGLGPLDERFVGYGYEDNDYCERASAAGWHLGVFHGCAVDHSGKVPSTFRSRRDIQAMLERNRRIYQEKKRGVSGPNGRPRESAPARHSRTELAVQGGPPGASGRVDLLYLAWNRLEFTRETFAALLANTDWNEVRELVVYDDGSVDGTREWLRTNIARVPASHRLHYTSFGSPVTAMTHFIEHSRVPILAKLDNDAMCPPGWLAESLVVFDRNPDLDLLGIEAMYPHDERSPLPRGYAPAEFISGLGLYRRAAFGASRPNAFKKYYGLEEWQMMQGGKLRRGWIKPALPVFLLDRMPLDPWRALSLEYTRRGWQRATPSIYPRECTLWHWRFLPPTPPVQPDVVTPASASDVAAPARAELASPGVELAQLPSGGPSDGLLPPGNGSHSADGLRLNIRWCGDPLPHFTNYSLDPRCDDAVDLKGEWPWGDGIATEVRAWNVVERLHDKIRTMNELWRILRDGGTTEIVLPTTDGPGAFQDPTQVSYWNRRSFFYYEEGNPYRERCAARYGIKARFQVLAERLEPTPDGPRLSITLRAVKSDWAVTAPVRTKPAEIVASIVPPAEFVCALRVKNEAEHIREVIESVLPLCDRILLFDDHSTDATVEIARSFGERCTLLDSPFQGLDEARDKNYVLEHLIRVDPGWVLWIDGDEVLERTGPAALRAAAKVLGIGAYSLRIAYLWDEADRVRVDGVYGSFARPSFFRLRGQPASQLRFAATGHGGNFHCGNVPAGIQGAIRALPIRLKHYGYLTAAQRKRKYEWYNAMDPNNAAEDNYRHLIGIPGARHAPGPPAFVPWRE